MTRAAPRIPQALVKTLVRLDDGTLAIAEICRRVGAEAEARGFTRPSYERVRELVHVYRQISPRHRRRGPSMLQIYAEASAGLRSGASAYDNLMRPREDRH